MKEQDILLIKLKMKELGISTKNLASKIHTSSGKLDRILNRKDYSEVLEGRLIKWLERKS